MTQIIIKSTHNHIFRSMEDAGQFHHNLSFSPSCELRSFFLLLQLIPSKPNDLLIAKWSQFIEQPGLWTVKPGKLNTANNHFSTARVAVLSANAINIVAELRLRTGSSEWLFPTLAGMKKSDRDVAIADYVISIWPHYRLDIDKFQYFFDDVAKKISPFKAAFITDALNHSGKDLSLINITHRRTLAEFWAIELTNNAHKFFSPRYQ